MGIDLVSRSKIYWFKQAALAGAALIATPTLSLAQIAAAPPGAGTVEEVVVTGTRLNTTGFTTPTPVTTLSAAQLGQRALPGIGEAVVELPAFRAGATTQTNQLGSQQIGAIFADLRGLGAARTLVLVNGARHVPTTLTGQVDLNVIPSILVRQAEVVTGGASAAYGSDAVAGVLNLLMDTRFVGFKGEVSHGQSERGDNIDNKVAAAFGAPLAGGRGHLLAGLEYARNGGVGDAYTRPRGREEWQQVRNPAWPANGLPNRIQTPNAHFTSLAEGGLITAGPLRGITFLPGGTPTNFQYGSLVGTQYQIGGSGYGETFLRGIYLSVPVTRYSAFARGEYDLAETATVFAELSYSRAIGKSHGPQPRDQGSITIRRDNAYLPASVAARMDDPNGDGNISDRITTFSLGRLSTDLGMPQARSDTPATRALIGVKGDVGGGWAYDAYYQYGQVDYESVISGVRIEARWPLAHDAVVGPGGQIVCRSTLTNPTNGCVPVNLFGFGSPSQAAKAYLLGVQWAQRDVTQGVAAANLRGSPFSTWAGEVSLAAGGEYRKDEVEATSDPISQANGFNFGNPKPIKGAITVKEVYLETGVPLLRDSALGKSLDFNGAVRRTDYSTSGPVTTWKVGLSYEPIEGMRLRATQSRDIRAPNVAELYTGSQFGTTQVIDSLTGTQRLVQTATTGNVNLDPEKADTFTAGIVLQPSFAPRLRVSLDYYDIDIADAIATLGAQILVDRCNAGATEFCQYVTRGAGNAITLLTLAQLNLNAIEARGVDLEVDYRLALSDVLDGLSGNLDFRLVANKALDLIIKDSSGSINRAGQTGAAVGATPGVPDYTLNGTTTFSDGPLTANLNLRYIPEGIYDVTLVGPEDSGYSPSLANSVNVNRVKAALYTNVSVDYALGAERAVHLFGAVSNLLDKQPPISAGTTVTNPALFDHIGRTYRVGARFAF